MKKILLSMALCLGTAFFAVNMNAQDKIGFVNVAATVDDISDADEKAAADWFMATYGGDYLPVSEITPAKLDEYKALWIYVDDNSNAVLPGGLLESGVLAAVTDWYKEGGNLLLSTFGNIYLTDLGRVDYYPSVKGTGPAVQNSDVWYVSPTYGTWPGRTILVDNSDDPIYAGLVSEPKTRDDGAEYVHYPLVDAGMKEDHNCFWTMGDDPVLGDPGASNSLFMTGWEEKWGAEALGTWDHIQDYFGAAIVRWNPQGDYKGTVITIGVAAYQWAQAGNPYQGNVERMTKNALDELNPITTNIEADTSDVNISLYNNVLSISGYETASAKIYSVNGTLEGQYNAAQVAAGINVSNLPQGVYVVSVQTEDGKIFSIKIIR